MVRGLLTLAGLAVAIGALYVYTVSEHAASCEACMVFEGRRACRTAAAAEEERARQHAIMAACSLITRGVTEDLACQRSVPERLTCE